MPVVLRVILFVSSLLSFLFVVRSLRKAKVQIYDTTFWIILSALFVVLSIFPQIAIGLAELIGIQSPINLVFLIIIFFLLGHCFIQSLRFSSLEDRFNRLVSDEALKENDRNKEKKSEAE
jgi:hypothetical protein